MTSSLCDIATRIIEKATKAGAEAADVIAMQNSLLLASLRLSQLEHIERAESRGFGLRVMIGKKQALVSSTDWSDKAVDALVVRAIDMAKVSPDDPYIGLADKALLAKEIPELELCDEGEPTADSLIDAAKTAEEAALGVKGVTNSGGADASFSRNTIALVTSHGFSHQYDTSNYTISASVVAGEGTGMERDYDYASARFREDLEAPAVIGKNAGEKAVRRLGPRKVATAKVPVVFDPQVGKSLLGNMASGINGAAIARGTSFLKDQLGKKIFPATVSVIDEPHLKRGLSSRPFDAEGVAGVKRSIIENGVLTTWLLDTRSANQLNMKTTGHAVRGFASVPVPSASNLYMLPGKETPEALIKPIKSGFYVTELFGMGVNMITGDYSQGASGFWIENGEIAYPVSEVTIAGHLRDMFMHLTPAKDLVLRYGINVPTLLIESMTVAGG